MAGCLLRPFFCPVLIEPLFPLLHHPLLQKLLQEPVWRLSREPAHFRQVFRRLPAQFRCDGTQPPLVPCRLPVPLELPFHLQSSFVLELHKIWYHRRSRTTRYLFLCPASVLELHKLLVLPARKGMPKNVAREKMSISSVQRVWTFLLEVLKRSNT